MKIELSPYAIGNMLYLNANALEDDKRLLGDLLTSSKSGLFKDSFLGKTCVAIENLWNQVKDNDEFKNTLNSKDLNIVTKEVTKAIDMLRTYK